MSKLNEILGKINKLRSLDKEFEVFGADSHEYKLNPVLTEEQIKEYETKYNLLIPQEYREFLLKIGDGGCGGFYGLLPLLDNEDLEVQLDKEFAFTKDNPLKLMEMYDYISEQIDECNDEDAIDEKHEETMEMLFNKAVCGIKVLCHEGCGMYSVLVMKGNEAGNVWYFDFANDAGLFPLTNPETKKSLNFLDWYLLWLDNSIKEMELGQEEIWGYANYIN